MNDDTKAFESELIRRTESGDAEAGREILRSLISHIDHRQWESSLFPYLSTCLSQYIDEGVAIERAVGLEDDAKGGRPAKYNSMELMAVDALLRFHADYGLEEAATWMNEHILIGSSDSGPDRSTIQKLRRDFRPGLDAAEEGLLKRDTLIVMAGSLRENLRGVIPHT